MKKQVKDYLITAIGILLFGTALILMKAFDNPQGVMRTLPYVCLGFGCGIFGHGMGNIISSKTMKRYPDIQKQLEIDTNDERNIAIANRAKAKAYDMMIFVFGALMVSFALLGIDMEVVLLLVSAYLFVIGYDIYYRSKYDKEM